ncbi:uncharacterized protein LOC112566517 [Pomacea canaliculata]|uniref:uncharacterized protein LOC112566517 n=1 Tax=Pomacea canaliculata TaxID=400727 RepID=UPI000D726666|nr:uncharacterized protein LOC112566517 [Pomacea canaliculata]
MKLSLLVLGAIVLLVQGTAQKDKRGPKVQGTAQKDKRGPKVNPVTRTTAATTVLNKPAPVATTPDRKRPTPAKAAARQMTVTPATIRGTETKTRKKGKKSFSELLQLLEKNTKTTPKRLTGKPGKWQARFFVTKSLISDTILINKCVLAVTDNNKLSSEDCIGLSR